MSTQSLPSTSDEKQPHLITQNDNDDILITIKTSSTSLSTSLPQEKPNNVPPPPPSSDEGLPRLPLLFVMTGVTLASFLMLLDMTILATAIPKITTEYHSLTSIGWYGAAYQLSSAAMQPLTGKLYSNFRTKWTFITFISIFELGSLLCGAANGSDMFVVGRAVAGLGAAGIQNGAFGIIAHCVPLERRPALVGVVQGVAAFGLAAGPLIGGALTEYSSWRWCFYLNLPCGAVVCGLLVCAGVEERVAKPSAREVWGSIHRKVDLPGFALFAPAVTMLLLAVQWGGSQYPWKSAVIVGLFVGSGVNALVWLMWNWYRKDEALVPLSLLRRRNVWSSCLTLGFTMGPLSGAMYYLPFYFQSVKGASPSRSGIEVLPAIVSQLVMAIIAGRLLQRVGYYLPFSILSSILISVGYGLLSTLSPRTKTADWAGFQIMYGLGAGMGLQMPIVALQANVNTPAEIPIVMALAFFTATFTGALVLSFSDTIFNTSLRSLLQTSVPSPTAKGIISSGGTGFRGIVTASQLPTVISAYSTSVDRVFYLLMALTATCFFLAWGMGWKSIRTKKNSSSA